MILDANKTAVTFKAFCDENRIRKFTEQAYHIGLTLEGEEK